ncbi:Zinc finger C2H2 [Penicillium verrucosum]|uniref:Zinc finger C2H2 n=1 Tax=Penicillium verrucosum TaxID=60171 RepID=UPI0025456F32|nr:Zinc finger C2H2 [Penicillium verrucosum]KAJ5922757.1 Zinc finger C2H2 [Penicillium verrucosum]
MSQSKYEAYKIKEESEDINLEAREIPKYIFYKVYAENIPIFLNFLIFFLLIAAIDIAFRDYSLVNKILDTIDTYKKVGYLEDKILKIIYIREEIRNLLIFH